MADNWWKSDIPVGADEAVAVLPELAEEENGK